MLGIAVDCILIPHGGICRVDAEHKHTVTRQILVPALLLAVLQHEEFFLHWGVDAETGIAFMNRIQRVAAFSIDNSRCGKAHHIALKE